jgi:TetR/AcrR family transcriptional regulator, lmrAB and yxaGH operons repressor
MGQHATSRANGRRSRTAFISATAELLRRQGYAATGLNEIVARSGAPKGSLYFHFPGGKRELAQAAMEQSGEQLRGAIAAVMAAETSFAAGLGSIIDLLGAGLEASGYRDGCPIATVTLEVAGGSDEDVRITAAEVFDGWLEALAERLRAEGLDEQAAERRALLVLSAIEGALILARARRDLAPLLAIRQELVELAR